MKKYILFLLFSVFVISQSVNAAFENAFVNPEVAAVGGAFTSIADTPAAVLYNPAGLAGINAYTININYTSFYNISAVNDYNLIIVMPYVWKGSVGILWNHQGIDDSLPIKDFSEDKFYFSYGFNLYDYIYIGYSFKYFYAKYEENKSAVYSGDIGFMLNFKIFHFGLMFSDFYSPVIEWYSGLREVLKRNLRIGLSINILKNLLISYDNDNLLESKNMQNNYFGIKYNLSDYNLSISAGVMNLYLDKYSITAGLLYMFKGVGIKYTYIHHYDLGMSNILGISLKF